MSSNESVIALDEIAIENKEVVSLVGGKALNLSRLIRTCSNAGVDSIEVPDGCVVTTEVFLQHLQAEGVSRKVIDDPALMVWQFVCLVIYYRII